MTILFWFRNDLRLADNPALTHAVTLAMQHKQPLCAVYVHDDTDATPWKTGAAGRWWLHHSLAQLSQALQQVGGQLHLRQGSALQEIPCLVANVGATSVLWNTRYEPWGQRVDAELADMLRHQHIDVHTHKAGLLFYPNDITNNSGSAYKVFTPFWKACWAAQNSIGTPLPVPHVNNLNWVPTGPKALTLANLNLLPTTPNWAAGWEKMWQPGSAGAHKQLTHFMNTGLANYSQARDLPAHPHGTSKLAAALHFGDISARQIWAQVMASPAENEAKHAYLRELGWRDFNHHLLYHFPQLPSHNWNNQFDNYPWKSPTLAPATGPTAALLMAWQRGQTGIPLVDAGMRELWHTGFMHNRVRMVVASFLIKNLGIDWRCGQSWFWDTLLDANLANNAANWQWVAGCGADAAPFFRIFNPVGQGQKFDPAGDYIRRWCPELARLPTDAIHAPWEAPALVLQAAGVMLGKTYPYPLVSLKFSREEALQAYHTLKKSL